MSRKAIIVSLLFFLTHLSVAQVTFIIESLPGATPGADTIFICGTFNNWVPNDPQYALQRQLNGNLAVAIPGSFGNFEYKFTRGSWTKVETDGENRYTANRIFRVGSANEIFVRIENWLDLGGARKLNYIVFYFFACAFQGIALCLLAYRIHKKDALKFRTLLAINSIIIGLLILLVSYETANQIWQSYFTFVFHVALFCWGPIMLFFINAFASGKIVSRLYLYFIPASLTLFVVIVRMANISAFRFLSVTVWPPLTLANLVFITTGFIFNLVIFIKIFRRFAFLKLKGGSDSNPKTNLLYYFFWTSFTALLLVAVNTLVVCSGIHNSFVEGYHAVAVVLSALIFIETYFLWKHPELVKEEKASSIFIDDPENWIEKINSLMRSDKPYKNPELSVSDLAGMLGTRPHVLSKIINDSYHKNFRDFVNTYRVEEFIALANTKEFRHYTFLALAQEVGFNSKSTFNLVFKKLTHQSPRQYFKSKAFS